MTEPHFSLEALAYACGAESFHEQNTATPYLPISDVLHMLPDGHRGLPEGWKYWDHEPRLVILRGDAPVPAALSLSPNCSRWDVAYHLGVGDSECPHTDGDDCDWCGGTRQITWPDVKLLVCIPPLHLQHSPYTDLVCPDCALCVAHGHVDEPEEGWEPGPGFWVVGEQVDELSRATCDCCGSTTAGPRYEAYRQDEQQEA